MAFWKHERRPDASALQEDPAPGKQARSAKGIWKIALAAAATIIAVIVLVVALTPNSKGDDTAPTPNDVDSGLDSGTKYVTKNVQVGDYVLFGSYEQDNDLSNGKEEIEWLVLEIQDGNAFLISKYALDCKQYNTRYTNVTWETSSLRQWLIGEFFDAAFSAEEQEIIPTVTVSPGRNPKYRNDPGNETQDQVFILSIMEASQYFKTDSERMCEPTDYAVANGVIKNSINGNCWWWLRSPGYYQFNAAGVFNNIDMWGYDVDGIVDAVRPAIWVDLSKL